VLSQFKVLAFCLGTLVCVDGLTQSVATPVTPPTPTGARTEDPLTLNFQDVDIRVFIAAVSELTHRNFVVDPRVQGRITVISAAPTAPDELYQVFLSIIKVHGFTALAKDGITTILPEMLAKQDATPTLTPGSMRRGEDIVTGVIPVHFVSAAELVPVLRPLLPQDSHLAATAGTNVMIVADSASNVDRIVEIVARLDIDNSSGIEVIRLLNASASDVATTLETLSSKTLGATPVPGTVATAFAADVRTNSILLAGASATKLRYRAIIASLDASQSETETITVLPLRFANAKDMTAVMQEALGGQPSSADSTPSAGDGKLANLRPAAGDSGPSALGEVRITADEATNAVIVQGPPRDVKRVLAVIAQLDVRRAQVLVEGIVAEVSGSTSDELGVQWRTNVPSQGIAAGAVFPGKTAGPIGDSFTASDAVSFLTGLSLGYISGGDLRGLIRALSSDTLTNVLSTPSLMTLDNAEAEIVVGQNVPFVTGQFTNSTTTPDNPFQTIQRQDVGIKLHVKPQINEGDTVTMDIEQEVSSVAEGTVGADLITNKRSIKTSVQVDNGSIIVLGGLIGDDARANREKIPFVGDIPLLGNLFKSSRRSANKTNLMVFLRPQIVRDRASAQALSKVRYEGIRNGQQQQNRDPTEKILPNHGPVLPDGIFE
jgi:general secretion pathway protein D